MAEFKNDGSSCAECEKALQDPLWGIYQSSCSGCTVRMLANGPGLFLSRRSGKLHPSYLAALKSAFGDEWRAWHERVKAEYARMQALREGVDHG